MPIYEYACQRCEHVFDALQKMDAEPLKDCPECGEPTLKKLLSAPNFRLKGAGWYETDFKKDNQRNLADSDKKKSDDSKAGAGKSEAKSDAKSDAKSETKAKDAGGKSSKSSADKAD
jgi:putative FmdB family regulatory protein